MLAVLQSTINLLTTVIISISVIFIGFIIGKLVKLALSFFIKGIEIEHLFQKLGLKTLILHSLPSLDQYCVIFVFFVISFNMLGITKIILVLLVITLVILFFFYSFS